MSRFLAPPTFLAIGLLVVALAIGLMASGGLRTTHAQVVEPPPNCVLDGVLVCFSLEPETDTNPVGDNHTVIATLTVNDNPLEENPVVILVLDGPNAGKSAIGLTDAAGQLGLTYTGAGGTGTDTIVAEACFVKDCSEAFEVFIPDCLAEPAVCIAELEGFCLERPEVCAVDDATKDWVEPTSITLDPPTATNEVGTNHTVTATINDSNPVADVNVFFDVIDGPNKADTGTDTTDASGEATFTYTGDGGAGEDIIQACFLTPPAPTPAATPTATATATATPTGTPTPSVEPGVLPPSGGGTCDMATKTWTGVVLAATATPAPTATPVTPIALPVSGGTPSDGSSALAWLAAIAGVMAAMTGGGLWLAYQRRRVR